MNADAYLRERPFTSVFLLHSRCHLSQLVPRISFSRAPGGTKRFFNVLSPSKPARRLKTSRFFLTRPGLAPSLLKNRQAFRPVRNANTRRNLNKMRLSRAGIYGRVAKICRSDSTRKVDHRSCQLIGVAHLRIANECAGSKRIHRNVRTGNDLGG